MPYFVYRITPPLQLDHVETLASYQEARALARERRAAEDPASGVIWRLIFARQRAEAERLLATPREERVIGED